MEEKTRELSLGERRIRTDFNVKADSSVEYFKVETAKLIDSLENVKDNITPVTVSKSEKIRLIALAQTAYEEAAMWAVKAATI